MEPPVRWVFPTTEIPEHGGSHGSATHEAARQNTWQKGSEASTTQDAGIVSARPQRRHREMVSGPVLLPLAGDQGSEVVAAARLLAGPADDLERPANPADALRRSARRGAVVVSQVDVGQ